MRRKRKRLHTIVNFHWYLGLTIGFAYDYGVFFIMLGPLQIEIERVLSQEP